MKQESNFCFVLLVVAEQDEEQEDLHVVEVIVCVHILEERSRFKDVKKSRASLLQKEILVEGLPFNDSFQDFMLVINFLLG